MTAARAIGEIRAMRCLTAFPAITSDEEEGRFLSAQAFAAALRTRFSEKDWEKLSDPDQLLESETRYRVPDSASNEPLFSGLEEGATRLPGFPGLSFRDPRATRRFSRPELSAVRSSSPAR